MKTMIKLIIKTIIKNILGPLKTIIKTIIKHILNCLALLWILIQIIWSLLKFKVIRLIESLKKRNLKADMIELFKWLFLEDKNNHLTIKDHIEILNYYKNRIYIFFISIYKGIINKIDEWYTTFIFNLLLTFFIFYYTHIDTRKKKLSTFIAQYSYFFYSRVVWRVWRVYDKLKKTTTYRKIEHKILNIRLIYKFIECIIIGIVESRIDLYYFIYFKLINIYEKFLNKFYIFDAKIDRFNKDTEYMYLKYKYQLYQYLLKKQEIILFNIILFIYKYILLPLYFTPSKLWFIIQKIFFWIKKKFSLSYFLFSRLAQTMFVPSRQESRLETLYEKKKERKRGRRKRKKIIYKDRDKR